ELQLGRRAATTGATADCVRSATAGKGTHMTLSQNARVAGLLYLLGSLFGIVRLIYVPNKLLVYGDAAATANNIAQHEWLFRFGIVSYLLCGLLWIFVTLALYRLF